MYNAKVFHIMIGTPSDINEEVAIVKETVHNWNDLNSERERIVLLPKHLASSTYPISGVRPQESINKQIVLKSDLLICIFGARLGAPTGNEMSGSIEEINEHLKAGKVVMVFFKNSGSYDIDPDQLKKVRDYQNSIKDSVLWVTVKDEDEFRRLLPDKLQLYLNDNWLRHSEEEEIHDDEILRGADRAISSAQNSISFNGFVEALNTLFDALKELQQCYNKKRAKKTIEIVLEFIHEILNARTKIGKCRVSKGKRDNYISLIHSVGGAYESNIVELLKKAEEVNEDFDELGDMMMDVYGDGELGKKIVQDAINSVEK